VATRVYEEVDITLQDDTELTLRPLPIGPLRRFMEAWNKFGEVKSEEEGLKVFIDCAGIALERDFKKAGKFDSLKATEAERKKGEFLSAEYKDYLEDTLDLDTIYKILDVCGGLKLNQDPKALQEAAALLDQVGEN
jgi:hypothetical protein